MNTGRNLIIGFDQGGKHYDIIIKKDADEFCTMWYFLLFEGVDTWQNQSINGEAMTALLDTQPVNAIPQNLVQVSVDAVNAFLKNKFKGTDVSMTWIEQLEAVLARIVFFRDAAGVPQIKI